MPTIIYSLQFELEPAKPGTSLSLIAPLDRFGRGKHCRPATAGKRLVDVQPGDWILHRGRRYHVTGVKAYRSHQVSAQYQPSDGYLAHDPLEVR